MLRILNTIPNTNICGENNGAINHLLEFYMNLLHSSSQKIPGRFNPASYEKIIEQSFKPAWYNSYKINEMEDMIRETITKMFKKDETTLIWGFKEIRYQNNYIQGIRYFKKLFPQTKVIIQIRENIQQQSKSGWFKKDKHAILKLDRDNKELIEFYQQNKEWCYLNSFERLFDLKNIQNIFQFIDCRENFDEQRILEVLSNSMET
jgi:hypothetical protein